MAQYDKRELKPLCQQDSEGFGVVLDCVWRALFFEALAQKFKLPFTIEVFGGDGNMFCSVIVEHDPGGKIHNYFLITPVGTSPGMFPVDVRLKGQEGKAMRLKIEPPSGPGDFTVSFGQLRYRCLRGKPQ